MYLQEHACWKTGKGRFGFLTRGALGILAGRGKNFGIERQKTLHLQKLNFCLCEMRRVVDGVAPCW